MLFITDAMYASMYENIEIDKVGASLCSCACNCSCHCMCRRFTLDFDEFV